MISKVSCIPLLPAGPEEGVDDGGKELQGAEHTREHQDIDDISKHNRGDIVGNLVQDGSDILNMIILH